MQIGLKNRSFIKKLLLQIHTLGSVKTPFVVSSNKWFICQNKGCMKLMRLLTRAMPAGLNYLIKTCITAGIIFARLHISQS